MSLKKDGEETIASFSLEVEASPEKIQIEADEIFQSLLTEAINISGDHGIPHKEISTDINKETIKEGRKFFHRNFAVCAIAIIATEFLQWPIRRITAFVLKNDEYNDRKFAFFRGIVTIFHIQKWFQKDFDDNSAESAQDAYVVRKMHQNGLEKLRDKAPIPKNCPKKDRLHILAAIRKDMVDVKTPDYLPSIMTESPSTPMSQFDMVIVLGVFYFLFDVCPKEVGLYSKKGYESYIQYVGLLGKYLGIQDKFNLPLIKNPEVRKSVSKKIWEEIMIPCFKNFHEKEFINLSYFSESPFLLFNPIALLMHSLIKDLFGIKPAKNTKEQVNFANNLLYKFKSLALFFLRFRLIVFGVNLSFKTFFWFMTLITRKQWNDSTKGNTGSLGCPI